MGSTDKFITGKGNACEHASVWTERTNALLGIAELHRSPLCSNLDSTRDQPRPLTA